MRYFTISINRIHALRTFPYVIFRTFIAAGLLSALFSTRGMSATLPIEVIGNAGYTHSVQFQLENSEGVTHLYLKAHRLAFRDAGVNPNRGPKGSVKLNNGTWIDLINENVTCYDHESRYGCLNGSYHTVRLSLPVTNFQKGTNILVFRFNKTDKVTSGYRILEFNVLKKNKKLLPTSNFQHTDPKSWKPPLPFTKDISEGKKLWYSAKLLEFPGGPPIKATCAACHAQDGSDMEYFAFSNWSIQERSKFHGLNQKQSEQIASYIRSLADKGIQRHGRPWNPPYQPGPGLDSKPVEQWAAGAGLKWVLEEDKQMLPYLFPEGTNKSAVDNVVSIRGTLNVREMPIALQLPDWQAWLPEIHPVDIWGDAFYTTEPYKTYLATRTKLSNGESQKMRVEKSRIQNQDLLNVLDPLRKSTDQFTKQGGALPCRNNAVHGGAGFQMLGRPKTAPKKETWRDPKVCEEPLRSINHWNAVKHWEVMQEFSLEEATADIYPYGEKRGWPGGTRQVFEMAPHRIGNDSYTFSHLKKAQGSYFNTAWYQLQVVLNAGNRNPQKNRPPDWKYQMNHLYHAAKDNNHPATLRYVQSLIKMQQNLDMRKPKNRAVAANHFPFRTDRGPEANGWWITHVTPWRYISVGGSHFFNQQKRFDLWNELDKINPGLKNKVQDSLLRDWLEKTETYETKQFKRANDNPNAINTIDYVPTPHDGKKYLISSSRTHADGVYRAIPHMKENGMDTALIERLRVWGKKMWPEGDWEALKEEP